MGLKIWEHYGYGTTYKILKKNNRQNTTSVRVRTSLTSVEELLNNNPDYAKTSVEGILCYGGKSRFGNSRKPTMRRSSPSGRPPKRSSTNSKSRSPSEAFLFNGNADSSPPQRDDRDLWLDPSAFNLGVYDTSKITSM
jgi:hypothetical protein